MAVALADRDMGAVVRIFRRWTGLSQSRVSALVGIPQPHISEMERGDRRVAALEVFERFADGLGIPRHLLGLADENVGSQQNVMSDIGGVNYRAKEEGIDSRVRASHEDWLRIRRLLNLHRAELTQVAARLYPSSIQLGNTGLLISPEWKLGGPIELGSINLEWGQAGSPAVNGNHQETRPLRPLQSVGQIYSKYHRAMRDLDRPRLFENRACYRLLAARWSDSMDGHLSLAQMCYFDMIDVGEALAHELALNAFDPKGKLAVDRLDWQVLPFRRMIRNPFDLATYPLMLSISTLTVRRGASGTSFLLLRRSAQRVAIAGGMLSVMPTGVFQPASVAASQDSPDFDLWRNIMREYSEEFLGNPEHDGDGPPIDYDNTEPFRFMSQARAQGKIRVYCLGIGIDALNYVADLLTVAVFDSDTFDHLFDGMGDQNEEGSIATSDKENRTFTFDRITIEQILTTESLAPSGAACLYLALRHREAILR